jgi:hypothetical protein
VGGGLARLEHHLHPLPLTPIRFPWLQTGALAMENFPSFWISQPNRPWGWEGADTEGTTCLFSADCVSPAPS